MYSSNSSVSVHGWKACCAVTSQTKLRYRSDEVGSGRDRSPRQRRTINFLYMFFRPSVLITFGGGWFEGTIVSIGIEYSASILYLWSYWCDIDWLTFDQLYFIQILCRMKFSPCVTMLSRVTRSGHQIHPKSNVFRLFATIQRKVFQLIYSLPYQLARSTTLTTFYTADVSCKLP